MKSLPLVPRSSWLTSPLFRWSIAIAAAGLSGVVLFQLLGVHVFQSIGMPHEYCYLRDARLIWTNVISDASIGLAYVSISLTLATLVYRASKDIPFNGVFLAFGLFIVSCGVTHFMEVWVIWEPMYWLSGYIKIFTALASVATALALFPLVPKIYALIEDARKGEQRRLEIEQLNQELERFNYSVAHDLRAPLRGIAGLGSALQEDFAEELPPAAKEYITRMQESASRMNALISDLLRYTTIGRQEIALGPVSMADVLDRARAALESEIRERQAEIIISQPLPTVQGDPTLLLVIFQNLLGNALKFVAPGTRPRIEIAAETTKQQACLGLTDNGIGIPVEHRQQIFKMFERVHANYAGTGIGLAIVHRAIERLHGKIVVEDSPHGSGTRFCVFLPVPAPSSVGAFLRSPGALRTSSPEESAIAARGDARKR